MSNGNKKDSNESPKKGGQFSALMKEVFRYFNEDDSDNPMIALGTENSGSSWELTSKDLPAKNGPLGQAGESERDTVDMKTLPDDRKAKYRIFEQMAKDSLISTALDIHLAHAYSVDLKTGKAITLKIKEGREAEADYVNRLQYEVVDPFNKNIMSWGRVMAKLGVCYIRPHAETGKGIVDWECNYYTLPSNIREYERAGQTVGFTSDNLKKKDSGGEIVLAEPWMLIPLKMPNWTPSVDKEPLHFSTKEFSLFDDGYHRIPVETQNYGVSLLENVYEPWCQIIEGLKSLMASRNNASHIDRFISVNTAGLDIANAAEYINLVTNQIKKDKEQAARKASKGGILPTVWNSIFPSMNDGKGGVTIDTQVISPDIQHIEDIMFNLKRFAGGIGIDPSMLGFSDMLAGGLGEGGFLRTSIHSALKALMLRRAADTAVQRSIDIHTAYRDGKVWPIEDRPYELVFNSMSTAIAIEENDANESKASYVSIVTSIIDMIENGSLSKSETYKNYVLTNQLNFSTEDAKKIIAELAVKLPEDEVLLESLRVPSHLRNKDFIRNAVMDVFSELGTVSENDDE